MESTAFSRVMKSQWKTYKRALLESGFETPLQWYIQFDSDAVNRIQGQSDTILSSRDNLHTLYRISEYQEQPYVFLAHNPELQLNEFVHSEISDHQKEHMMLSEIPEVEPNAFASVTEPNWAGYLSGCATNGEGTTWSAKLGFLLKMIAEYSGEFSLPDKPRDLFQPNGQGSVGSFFDYFYYTNVFKLPTPTGIGDSVFSGADIDRWFYRDELVNELKSTSADVVFSFGDAAFKSLKPHLSPAPVEVEYPEPTVDTTVSNAHGTLFRWEEVDMDVLVMNHFSGPTPSWKGSLRRGRLEQSLRYLSEQGHI